MLADRKPEGGGAPLIVQMLACSFLWASGLLLIKIVGRDLSPFALTAARGMMGGGLLAAWLLFQRQDIRPRGREWRDWIALGVLQGIVPNTLTAYALGQITAGLTSMIQASTPLIVAVLAQGLYADERLTPRRAAGLMTGFGGMALLIGPAAFGAGAVEATGVLAMAAAAFSYALGNLYVRGIPAPQPIRLALGQQLFSGFPMLVAMLVVAGPSAFAGLSQVPVELVCLGVFGTALPIVLYMRILRAAGPTVGSMNGYFLPPWTVLLGFVLLGESVSLREMIATAIILAGVMATSASDLPRFGQSAASGSKRRRLGPARRALVRPVRG